MFSLFRKKEKPLLSKPEQTLVVNAIKKAEKTTSGEIRVFMEERCAYPDPMNRASELFFKLKMERTKNKNAVLVYVALTDRLMALYGDQGIYTETGGDPYWTEQINQMKSYFTEGKIAEGLAHCVAEIGNALATHFPYNEHTDKNEIPDDIIFGDQKN